MFFPFQYKFKRRSRLDSFSILAIFPEVESYKQYLLIGAFAQSPLSLISLKDKIC